jgi:pyruvate-ferredoxin/flavodoxin oxidoreductase
VEQPPLRVPERENWDFFLTIPDLDRRNIKVGSIRQQQIQEPLFEFSGRIQCSLPALPELCT